MKDHNHPRLDAAVSRRDVAAQNVQRLQGRLAAADDDVAEIELECHQRGVIPDKLDVAILQLGRRYETAVAAFEKDIDKAEGQLAPFV